MGALIRFMRLSPKDAFLYLLARCLPEEPTPAARARVLLPSERNQLYDAELALIDWSHAIAHRKSRIAFLEKQIADTSSATIHQIAK